MSEAEQGEEQSLEDILSSIREKISATPDMSIPVTPAPKTATQTDIEAAGGNSPLITATTSKSQQNTDVFTGGLSDVLNRIDAQEQDEDVSTITVDDNLSDLLDDPLPDPVQQLRSLNNSSQAETDNSVDANRSPASTWPQNGLTGDSEASADNLLEDSFSNPSDLGSFKAGNSTFVDTPTVSEGGLTARLKATDPVPSNSLQDEIQTEINAPESESGQNQTDSSSVAVPRSMAALSSGFTMNTDGKKSDSLFDQGSSASDRSVTSSPSSTMFGSSPVTTARSPSFTGSENISNDPDVTSTASEQIKLSVSATNAQPVSSPSETYVPSQAAVSPVVSETPNGLGDQAIASASAPSMTTATSGASSPLGEGLHAKTIEDMVAEMLRPMLHEWLEANLPRIVENALRIEVSQSSKDAGADA